MVKLLREIIFLFFPPRCSGCSKLGVTFCNACGKKIHPEFHFNNTSNTYYCYSYQEPVVKHCIWQAKFSNNLFGFAALYKQTAQTLFEEFSEQMLFEGAAHFVLVPIPLHKRRLKERGFNQSLLIAKEFSKQWQMPLCQNLLEKHKHTGSQARIENKQERLKNIRGSFRAVRTKRIQNKHVVLVDDVLTTGATISEARRLLLAAGAAKVSAVVLAH